MERIGGIKTINEFKELGIIKFIFQYAYYFFETILILFTISFGQRFMECISKNRIIPFSGVILACTWGLMHILTQDFATGIFAFISSIFSKFNNFNSVESYGFRKSVGLHTFTLSVTK